MQGKKNLLARGQKKKLVSGTSVRIQKNCLDRPLHLINRLSVAIITVVLCCDHQCLDSAYSEGINLLMK